MTITVQELEIIRYALVIGGDKSQVRALDIIMRELAQLRSDQLNIVDMSEMRIPRPNRRALRRNPA